MTFYKNLNELKVCIVENDGLLRDSMELFFRTKGCRVQAFGSAEEASPVLEARPPDIVICDFGLPGMDGMTLLSRFGAGHPDAVKILISAHPSAWLAEEARRAGVDEYLLKPFSIEEIERTLRRRLQSRSNGRGTPGGGKVSEEELA
jgi:two-component system C4-dicarboxylate transport response regulator DctD